MVIQGDPGTGKTVVVIYLFKLLQDLRQTSPEDALDPGSVFTKFFTQENRDLLADFRMGLVVPQ